MVSCPMCGAFAADEARYCPRCFHSMAIGQRAVSGTAQMDLPLESYKGTIVLEDLGGQRKVFTEAKFALALYYLGMFHPLIHGLWGFGLQWIAVFVVAFAGGFAILQANGDIVLVALVACLALPHTIYYHIHGKRLVIEHYRAQGWRVVQHIPDDKRMPWTIWRDPDGSKAALKAEALYRAGAGLTGSGAASIPAPKPGRVSALAVEPKQSFLPTFLSFGSMWVAFLVLGFTSRSVRAGGGPFAVFVGETLLLGCLAVCVLGMRKTARLRWLSGLWIPPILAFMVVLVHAWGKYQASLAGGG